MPVCWVVFPSLSPGSLIQSISQKYSVNGRTDYNSAQTKLGNFLASWLSLVGLLILWSCLELNALSITFMFASYEWLMWMKLVEDELVNFTVNFLPPLFCPSTPDRQYIASTEKSENCSTLRYSTLTETWSGAVLNLNCQGRLTFSLQPSLEEWSPKTFSSFCDFFVERCRISLWLQCTQREGLPLEAILYK